MKVLIGIICIVVPLLVGAISGWVTRKDVTGEWYTDLTKPSFQPPSWIFGPVWTTLYILMGIALMLVAWQPPSTTRTTAISLFAVQLVLNFFWSIIFFRCHQLGLATADILLLLVAIIATIIIFWQIRPLAGALMLLYLAWVLFASVLCTTIWRLNAR